MLFMRHGETTFNEAHNRTGGDPQIHDAPLTARGKKQVTQASQCLGKKVELILASPYTRALESATIAASLLNVPIVVEPLVGEYRQYSCDFGSPLCDLEKAWPHLDFTKVAQGAWWLPFPEPRASLKQRVQTFRQEWGYQAVADRTLVVSHWFFINAISGAYIDNAEVVEERV